MAGNVRFLDHRARCQVLDCETDLTVMKTFAMSTEVMRGSLRESYWGLFQALLLDPVTLILGDDRLLFY